MVVKKSYIKGKLLYWFMLILMLTLLAGPSIYRSRNPEYFVSDVYSQYEGAPTVDCSIDESRIELPGDVYIERDGNRCLVYDIPNKPYFSVEHPTLYTVCIKYGNLIALVCIIVCVWPRKKKNESGKKEEESGKEDRKTEE